jgi:ribulose-5-phosphate 4-epimerase/fuculose-1-phosphate aldolase
LEETVALGVTAASRPLFADGWQTRCDLAACHRLPDFFGWSDLIDTRITARVPGKCNHLLINPYGILFEEVTASSLVKIDVTGKKLEPSDSGVNTAGFAIPSAIYPARPEWVCVLQTHTIAGCAVSMQKNGRQPPKQYALGLIDDIACRDDAGTERSCEKCSRPLRHLGDCRIMVLRDHGLLIVGTSIAEPPLKAAYRMEQACPMHRIDPSYKR